MCMPLILVIAEISMLAAGSGEPVTQSVLNSIPLSNIINTNSAHTIVACMYSLFNFSHIF